MTHKLARTVFASSPVFATLLIAGRIGAQTPEWHHVHGGHLRGVFALDADRVWTAEDGGRIRFSQDGGDTWTYCFVDDQVRTDLRGVFVWKNPISDAMTGWAVGFNGIVVKSTDPTDPQIEWEWINEGDEVLNALGNPAELYDIWMFNEDEGCLAGFDGVLHETSDGGATWDRFGVQPEMLWDLEWLDPPGPEGPDPWDLYALYFWSTDEGIVAADNGSIFKFSTDTTPHWTWYWVENTAGICPDPNDENVEFWALDINPSDSDEVWLTGGVGTAMGYAYHSTNRGELWSQETIFLPPIHFEGESCGFATMYAVAAFGGSEHAVMGGYGAQMRRHHNLEEWQLPTQCCPEEVLQVIDLCTCEEDGPFTEDMPAWQQLPVDDDGQLQVIRDITRTTGNKAVAVGNFGMIRRADDISDTWGDPDDGWTEEASQMHIRLTGGDFVVNGGTVYGAVTGQGQQIRASNTGGQDWTYGGYTPSVLDEAQLGKYGRGLDLEPGGAGVAVGDDGFRAYTSNYGASWSLASANATDWRAVAFAPGTGTVFAVGDGGAVAKSTNSGSTWSSPGSPGSDNLYGVSFISTTHGIVVGADHAAYKTTDGGANWSAITVSGGQNGNDFNSVTAWAGSGSTVLAVAVGDSGEVAYNNGTAFSVSNPLSTTEILVDVDVVSTSPLEAWVCGNNGKVLHYASSTWSSPKSQTSDPLYQLAGTSSGIYGIGKQATIIKYY